MPTIQKSLVFSAKIEAMVVFSVVFLDYFALEPKPCYFVILLIFSYLIVRCSSHWSGSPQNGLRDEQTCEMTLASAYVLCHLSTAWLQLQVKERKSEWE